MTTYHFETEGRAANIGIANSVVHILPFKIDNSQPNIEFVAMLDEFYIFLNDSNVIWFDFCCEVIKPVR